MEITVLIDNKSCSELKAEWGLSIYIEYQDRKILLDTGCSGQFAENAGMLGIDLSLADTAVLSHAHFDHADGMEEFFRLNSKAPFLLRDKCCENCFSERPEGITYIGIKKGNLEKFADRIRYVKGDVCIGNDIWLIPHKNTGAYRKAERSGLFVQREGKMLSDDFSHEQSLVFRTEKGLVIFNSCSHSGADSIIDEVGKTFPEDRLYAMIGGFHLFKLSEQEVTDFGTRLSRTGIEKVVTGHCTGDAAYEILKGILKDKVSQMYSGMKISL